MAKLIGRQVAVGIGKEISRGTPVTSDFWVPWMELEAEQKIERVNNEQSLARIEDSDGGAIVSKYSEGTIKGKVKDTSLGLLMLSLFGESTPTEVEPGVYDHDFVVGQNVIHPSLTLVKKDPNQDVAYPNSVIDAIKFEFELGNYCMFEANFIGKAEQAAVSTASFSTERDYLPQFFTFKKAADQASLDAAAASSIRKLTLEIKQNVAKDDVLGSIEPDDINNQQFMIEGELTIRHLDNTYKDLQNNATYQALRFQLEHPDTIGAGSNPLIRFDLNRTQLFDYERSESQNELLEETLAFKAFYSIDDGTMAVVTMRNEIAGY